MLQSIDIEGALWNLKGAFVTNQKSKKYNKSKHIGRFSLYSTESLTKNKKICIQHNEKMDTSEI